MTETIDDADGLIERARDGDPIAGAAILGAQRDRLRRLISTRLDRRVSARIDPSDVVQEAMVDAATRLSGYLQDPPLPLLPWLRQFALERLAKLHRHHIGASKRSVAREVTPIGSGPGRAAIAGGTSPSGRLIRDEARERVRGAMARLPDGDRKLLALRNIEALPMARIAERLGITEGAAKVRHLRALRRLQALLEARP